MKKEVIEEKVLQTVAKIIGSEVRKNESMWPPICCGVVHQPKRPKDKSTITQKTINKL